MAIVVTSTWWTNYLRCKMETIPGTLVRFRLWSFGQNKWTKLCSKKETEFYEIASGKLPRRKKITEICTLFAGSVYMFYFCFSFTTVLLPLLLLLFYLCTMDVFLS